MMNEEWLSVIRDLVTKLSSRINDDQSVNDFKVVIHPKFMHEILIDQEFRFLSVEVGVEQTIGKLVGLKCEVCTCVDKVGVLYEKQKVSV